jgi:glycosyltransferase involved in cell wall biosynthesis
MSKIIVIDGSSTSHGGGLTHLVEFLNVGKNSKYYFEIIISKKVEKQIPKSKKIKIITHHLLEKTLLHRYFFKIFLLDKYINPQASILLSLSGDYLGKFRPFIGICQNMLLYEKEKRKEMDFFENSKFKIQKITQILSFRRSNGVIFLSKHAQKKVLPLIGKKKNKVVHFGISTRFLNNNRKFSRDNKLKFLYVSSIHTYKNQLNLLLAFKSLLDEGLDLKLTLVGPILNKKYWTKVEKIISEINKKSKSINYLKFVNYNEMHKIYNNHSIFIFPSICENMPNILLEACASKIPIMSSDTDPMPEFLGDNAIYFNSMDVENIKETILFSIENLEFLYENSEKAYVNLKKYSWKNNFNNTIEFIEEI